MNYNVKIGTFVYAYKLDAEQKMLYFTVRKGKKIVRCMKFDLSNTVAGFFESAPAKQNYLSLFIAVAALLIGVVLLAAAVDCLITNGKLFSLYAITLWLPCAWIYYSIAAIRALKIETQGSFYFNSTDDGDEFEIAYTHETRHEALAFADSTNELCGKKINYSSPLAEHKFANYTAKLFENEIVMYAANGSPVHMIKYKDIKEKVEFHDNRYTVNNIIFGTLAGICFLAALGMLVFAVALPIHLSMQNQFDWGVLLLACIAIIVVGCLPLSLGKWLYGFCHRRETFYLIADRDEDSWQNYFALMIGKNTSDASDFIETLHKLIQTAHRKEQGEK